jgi:hypothetical protein
MNLRTGSGQNIERPSAAQLAEVLGGLASDPGDFAILTRAEGTYIQVLAIGGGYVLEYQDGSLGEHYACTDPDLDLNAVVRAFHAYARGDDDWQASLPWQRQKLAGPSRTRKPLKLSRIVLIAVIVLAVAPPAVAVLLVRGADVDMRAVSSAVTAFEGVALILAITSGAIWLSERHRAAVSQALAERGVRTSGVVIGVCANIARGEEGTTASYAVRCRYETPAGIRHKRQSVTDRALHGVNIGDTCAVTYDAARPRRALVKFDHEPRKAKGVVPKPISAPSNRRLGLRSTILPGAGIALGMTAVLLVFEVLSRGDAGLTGTATRALLCCAPARVAVWTLVGSMGIVLLRQPIRRDRALVSHRAQVAASVCWEPNSAQYLVVCPYCGREIVPGTRRCPYCWLLTNVSRDRIGLGLLVLFAASASLLFWLEIARDRAYTSDATALSIAGIVLALWLLYTGIGEGRWWRRLRSGRSRL